LRWIKDAGTDAAQLAGGRHGGARMAFGEEGPGAGRTGAGRDSLLGAVPWFALVAALVLGGLLLAARAGDAYTHAAGLLFAAFGLVFGGRVLHRLLP
jgi:hypothetical protein